MSQKYKKTIENLKSNDNKLKEVIKKLYGDY